MTMAAPRRPSPAYEPGVRDGAVRGGHRARRPLNGTAGCTRAGAQAQVSASTSDARHTQKKNCKNDSSKAVVLVHAVRASNPPP